jgi:hypothetical protein
MERCGSSLRRCGGSIRRCAGSAGRSGSSATAPRTVVLRPRVRIWHLLRLIIFFMQVASRDGIWLWLSTGGRQRKTWGPRKKNTSIYIFDPTTQYSMAGCRELILSLQF